MTGNTPAPTAVNTNRATLASVAVNIMGGQGILPSSKQAMAATSNFVYEGGDQRSPMYDMAAALAYDERQKRAQGE